jgi:hypothetical protein
VTGSNLAAGATVEWNESPRTTTRVDATHLSVAIPASDLAGAGTASITITNPATAASNSLSFTINWLVAACSWSFGTDDEPEQTFLLLSKQYSMIALHSEQRFGWGLSYLSPKLQNCVPKTQNSGRGTRSGY